MLLTRYLLGKKTQRVEGSFKKTTHFKPLPFKYLLLIFPIQPDGWHFPDMPVDCHLSIIQEELYSFHFAGEKTENQTRKKPGAN